MKKSIALTAAAALIALPTLAFAQIPTGALTDKVKDKAVDTVLDNATPEDGFTVGKTLLQGGSKEDAAIAVVKGRAENKVEDFTGSNVKLDNLSKDGMIDAGKDVAIDNARGSASKYTNGVPSVGGVSTGNVKKAEGILIENAKSSATSYGDKATGSATKFGDKAGSYGTNDAPVIQKSGGATSSQPATTTTTAPLNCPAGTKDAGDGTCMITGDWNF